MQVVSKFILRQRCSSSGQDTFAAADGGSQSTTGSVLLVHDYRVGLEGVRSATGRWLRLSLSELLLNSEGVLVVYCVSVCGHSVR